jgi:hypothetical protein
MPVHRLQVEWIEGACQYRPWADTHLLEHPIRVDSPHWPDFVRVLGRRGAEELAAKVEVEGWFALPDDFVDGRARTYHVRPRGGYRIRAYLPRKLDAAPQ